MMAEPCSQNKRLILSAKALKTPKHSPTSGRRTPRSFVGTRTHTTLPRHGRPFSRPPHSTVTQCTHRSTSRGTPRHRLSHSRHSKIIDDARTGYPLMAISGFCTNRSNIAAPHASRRNGITSDKTRPENLILNNRSDATFALFQSSSPDPAGGHQYPIRLMPMLIRN